jgi:hypothetical protein
MAYCRAKIAGLMSIASFSIDSGVCADIERQSAISPSGSFIRKTLIRGHVPP